MITEKHKSQSKFISDITEQLGYVEAKQKMLEDDSKAFPRESQKIESDVEYSLDQIQQELAELAHDEDLVNLEDITAQYNEE